MHHSRVVRFCEERKGGERPISECSDWFHKLYKYFFVICGIDPFLIYKIQDKRTATGPSGKPPMGAEPLDGTREMWRFVNIMIYAPIGMHMLALGAVRLLNAVWLGKTSHRLRKSNQHQSSSWQVEWLEQMSVNLGDPFTRSTRFASLIYFGISFVCLLLIIILPAYLRRVHYDSSASRFLAKPQLEIRQVRRLVERQLNFIGMSFTVTHRSRWGRSEDRNKILISCRSAERRAVRRIESQYRMICGGQLDQRRLHQLYPRYYTNEGYLKLLNFAKPLIASLLIGNILVNVVSGVALIVIACADNLRDNLQTVISFLDMEYIRNALSGSQSLVLVEMYVMFLSASSAINFLIAGLLYQSYEQLGWIDDIAQELNSLLVHLRHRMPFALDENDDEIGDFKLLRAIVHLRMFDQLARRSTRVQTILVSCLVTILIECSVATILSRTFLQSDPDPDLQLSLIGCVWTFINLLLAMASAMPSRVLKTKKIVWSILAEQTRARDRSSGYKSCDDEDLLVNCWRKHVLNDEFIKNQHPVRALGIAVTFTRMLQANVLVMSVISWLQLY